jgi:hypothetical protein
VGLPLGLLLAASALPDPALSVRLRMPGRVAFLLSVKLLAQFLLVWAGSVQV